MTLGYILSRAVDLYSLVILAWVVTSWFPAARRHEVVRLLGKVAEPPLRVAGRIVPSTGGIDFSPMLVQFAFNKRNAFANLYNKDGLPALMFTTAGDPVGK